MGDDGSLWSHPRQRPPRCMVYCSGLNATAGLGLVPNPGFLMVVTTLRTAIAVENFRESWRIRQGESGLYTFGLDFPTVVSRRFWIWGFLEEAF